MHLECAHNGLVESRVERGPGLVHRIDPLVDLRVHFGCQQAHNRRLSSPRGPRKQQNAALPRMRREGFGEPRARIRYLSLVHGTVSLAYDVVY